MTISSGRAVMVTGCAGFIGATLCRRLLQNGIAVIGIDSIEGGYDPRIKHWRLEQLKGSSAFEYHNLSINDQDGLAALLSGRNVDAIVNLAALAGVRASIENPHEYYRVNVLGTLTLLETCRSFEIPTFVLASTSSIYGNAPQPFAEDGALGAMLSPYAASKKAAEDLSRTYHALFGFDVAILRYFTVYGPAGRPDMSIFRFIHWIASDEPVQVFGDGHQTRDFTFVDDVADGTAKAIDLTGFNTINLGNDNPSSLVDVLTILEQRLGRKALVETLPANDADVRATRANIARAADRLDWAPKISLEEGLGKTVDWYLENRELASGMVTG